MIPKRDAPPENIAIPELDPNVQAAINSLNWSMGQQHPWPFLKHFIQTFDPHDRIHGTKPFPDKLMYRIIAEVWFRTRLLIIPKSRQIMISWIMCALYLWDAMKDPNGFIFMTAQNEEKADILVKRQRFMYTALYNAGYAGMIPMMGKGPEGFGIKNACKFPDTNSEILGLEQGPDVFRSHVGSGILADEAAFQQYMDESWTALRRILGENRFTAVSTPNGRNWFYRMVFDIDEYGRRTKGKIADSRKIQNNIIPYAKHDSQEAYDLLNMPYAQFKEIPLANLVAACPGMEYWHNKTNKFHVLEVHHNADPDKSYDTERGKIWIDIEKEGTPVSDWRREMDIGWDIFAGRPVIDNWDVDTFVREFEFDPFAEIRLGVDFGLTGYACFLQKVVIGRQVQILIGDEIHLEESDTYELAEKVRDKLTVRCSQQWEEQNFMAHCDPAGLQRKETTRKDDLNTSIKILQSFIGKRTTTKKLSIANSTMIVRKQFSVMNGVPGVLVHPRCRHTIECLQGGWHFPQDSEEGVPEKDGIYDHCGDALRHGITNMITVRDQLLGIRPKKSRTYRTLRDPQTGRRRALTRVGGSSGSGYRDNFRVS